MTLFKIYRMNDNEIINYHVSIYRCIEYNGILSLLNIEIQSINQSITVYCNKLTLVYFKLTNGF